MQPSEAGHMSWRSAVRRLGDPFGRFQCPDHGGSVWRDTSFAAVSRAPFNKIAVYKARTPHQPTPDFAT
jgi:hypothetical protein